MRFGLVPLQTALGGILAHGVQLADGLFKKGRVVSADDIARLKAAGIDQVTVAHLDVDDVPEDEAARAVALVIAGEGVLAQQAFTGRANLHSETAGVLRVDVARVNAVNCLHESLTLATLKDYEMVSARQMIATVKVIPFAVPRDVLTKALAMISAQPLITVKNFLRLRVALIITTLPQTKPSIVVKSETAMAERVRSCGGELVQTITCAHSTTALAAEMTSLQNTEYDIFLLFGASAIVDRGDVLPAGLVQAGGEVLHLGMPVDPGNLLMLGNLNGKPVVGVPSCARSPKTNGFDWILQRLMTGEKVSAADVMAMGVGGLLAEIPTRPSPREKQATVPMAPQISAVVLAAGKSTRMGSNKLLANVNRAPLIRQTVSRILETSVAEVIVVTGHQANLVRTALEGLAVKFIHNDQYADGLSTSVRVGIQSVSEISDAAVVCLGDMPLVNARDIDRMIAAFSPADQRYVVVPQYEGTWGNPVLWGRDYFAGLCALDGDRGARKLLEELSHELVEISVENDGVIVDIDTPEALMSLAKAELP